MFLAVPWATKTHGKTTAAIAEHLDLMPSLLSLCGIKLPEAEVQEAPLAGQDLSPLLADPAAKLDKDWALSQFPRCRNKQAGSEVDFPWSGECLQGEAAVRTAIPYMVSLAPWFVCWRCCVAETETVGTGLHVENEPLPIHRMVRDKQGKGGHSS